MSGPDMAARFERAFGVWAETLLRMQVARNLVATRAWLALAR